MTGREDRKLLRDQFVLKRLVTGKTDQQIADEWNDRYGSEAESDAIAVGAQTIRMDRIRLMEKLSEEHKQTMGHTRALLYERLEQVIRAIADKVEEGNVSAIKIWLEAIEKQATLTGANAPMKVLAETDGNALLDDHQRAVAILNLIRKAHERKLESVLSNGHIIDVTPPP